ncbi:MAG: hypothetical protein EAZ24_11935 [Burkholderiales bacterium]|nr:MAG: hypothetical protein EAZ24_11935 [Burkholderiales bacterium]TAG81666.1 MAG: hypothetical protein EAZ21_05625 [Betaproteobacteria bacterium]
MNAPLDPPPLGIVMLDTSFERPLGDAGNPASWPFPVKIERVLRAYANEVVTGRFKDYQVFVKTINSLRASGCICVISTCGFLARLPQSIEGLRDEGVVLSTLLRYRALGQRLGEDRRVGIVTIDRRSIDEEIRNNCGIEADAIVVSPSRDGHFCRAILDAAHPLDTAQAEQEMVATALAAQRDYPQIGHWLFECANMPPYRAAVVRATGLPVYDTLQLGIEVHANALSKR